MTTGLAALRPKELRHFKLTVIVSGLAVVFYLLASQLWPWSPKRGAGLVFGFLAAVLFVFEMLYAGRRPRARPFGTARLWLQAHVYLGAVAFVAVLIHTGFRWPGGGMGFWLLGLSFWTTLSGLLGVWLQKWVPAALSDGLRVEALFERIPALVDKTRAEADDLARGSGQVLRTFYAKQVRASLLKVSPSWGYLFDVRRGRERALEPFRTVARFVEPSEQEKVEDLMNLFTDKLELDAHFSLQSLLRRWIALHVPPAALLLAFLLVHILSWVWY